MFCMSLLMYDEVAHTGEYVLLNNKGFSPCAIIAAYQSTVPSASTASPVSISIEAYHDRYRKMREMGYEGNRLLRELEKRIGKMAIKRTSPSTIRERSPLIKLGEKITFSF